jgi:hypothetical protein
MVEAPPFSPGFPRDGQAIVQVSVLWTGIVLMPIRITTFYFEADPVSDLDPSKKLGQVHNCQILRLQKSTAASIFEHF